MLIVVALITVCVLSFVNIIGTFLTCKNNRSALTKILLSPDSLSATKHNMNSPIGFIGLGIMGKGMLKNLVTKLVSSPCPYPSGVAY